MRYRRRRAPITATRGSSGRGSARPVAVLAGGAETPYPARMRGLHARLIEAGAVVSEMPPGFTGASLVLPGPQPHHRRALDDHDRGRGRDAVRVADHRRPRDRPRPRGRGGARARSPRATRRARTSCCTPAPRSSADARDVLDLVFGADAPPLPDAGAGRAARPGPAPRARRHRARRRDARGAGEHDGRGPGRVSDVVGAGAARARAARVRGTVCALHVKRYRSVGGRPSCGKTLVSANHVTAEIRRPRGSARRARARALDGSQRTPAGCWRASAATAAARRVAPLRRAGTCRSRRVPGRREGGRHREPRVVGEQRDHPVDVAVLHALGEPADDLALELGVGDRRSVASGRRKAGFERRPSPAQQAVDRRRAGLEHVGDLAAAVPEDVAEHEHRALLRREMLQADMNASAIDSFISRRASGPGASSGIPSRRASG